jgi:predicted transposase/invertase (TIGR01784 family)
MSDQINTPHDTIVRKALEDMHVVRNLLQHELPEQIAAQMDFSTTERIDGSYISKSMRSTYRDLVFRVQFKVKDDGKCNHAYIYTLFEHKSYMDDWCSLQLLKYMVAQWEIFHTAHPKEKLPPIIPLVLYHGKRGWHRRGILDLINIEDPAALRPYTPTFDYVLWDVAHMDRERLDFTLGTRAFLEILHHIKRSSLGQAFPRIARMLEMSSDDRHSVLEKIEMYLRYAVSCGDHIDEATIQQSLKDSNITEELMATLAQKWMNEGEARGKAIGKEEGKAIGKEQGIIGGQSTLLRKLIKLRFGQIPPYVEARLSEANSEQLERFAENVLTATTAEEVVTLN